MAAVKSVFFYLIIAKDYECSYHMEAIKIKRQNSRQKAIVSVRNPDNPTS